MLLLNKLLWLVTQAVPKPPSSGNRLNVEAEVALERDVNLAKCLAKVSSKQQERVIEKTTFLNTFRLWVILVRRCRMNWLSISYVWSVCR
jgi:hypothetical protein